MITHKPCRYQGKVNYKHSGSGFSLVELMIAMVLGLILIGGMVSIFSSNHSSSRLNHAIATIQENARFALDVISRDVRMAGFQGCAPITGRSISVKAIDAPFDDPLLGLAASSIWGSRVESATNWDPEPPWGASFSVPSSNQAVAGTNVLALQFGDSTTYALNAPVGITTPSTSGLIQIAGNAVDVNINEGDLAIIADCQGGDLFRVTATTPVGTTAVNIAHATGAATNSSGSLTAEYGNTTLLLNQALVMRFNSHIYYVGDTGIDNSEGDNITALYLQTYPFVTANPPVELVQGVEHLAISFSQIDALGSIRQVDAGNSAFDASQVQSVRIGILMASHDAIADMDDAKTYMLAGTAVAPEGSTSTLPGAVTHPADRRFRLAFNTTVKVRNVRTLE